MQNHRALRRQCQRWRPRMQRGMQIKNPFYTLRLILNSTSSPTSQPSVISALSHLILNDSSLAALGIDDDDHTLLFQDQVGIVRQATYNDKNNK